MRYRKLGKTDLKVSVVGMGTFQFGGEWGKSFAQHEVGEIIAAAASCGVNFIDTAECYGDHLSEKFVGKALKTCREKWIIATKFGHRFNGHMDRTPCWSAKDVVNQLEDSLRALQTDYIDLYQFHSGDNEDFDSDGVWETLNRQIELGKIRYLGVSIQHSLVVGSDLYQLKQLKKWNIDAIQIVYNMLNRDVEREILPFCKQNNIGVLARIPLARGYLSGKYSVDSKFSQDDLREGESVEEKLEMLKAVERLKKEEVPEGMNMAQYAMSWILRNDVVSACIPGCKNIEQARQNALAGV